MIFDTNRIDSIVEESGRVEDKYTGSGSLYFMQECAEDELDLFNAAIMTDFQEAAIGESAAELEALNEGFVETAVEKIKTLMKKFINWIKSVTKSAIDKLYQYLVKDNAAFCKRARNYIPRQLKDDYKYNGPALKNPKSLKITLESDVTLNAVKSIWENATKVETTDAVNKCKEALKERHDKFKEDLKGENSFEKTQIFSAKDKPASFVIEHIEFLESASKDKIKKINAKAKEMTKDANKIAKDAEKAVRKSNSTSDSERGKLSAMSECANVYKQTAQAMVTEDIRQMKKAIAIARGVVNKAVSSAKAVSVKEEAEYDEVYVNALNELAEYELDMMCEDMSIA